MISIFETRSVGEVGLFEAAHEYGHALHQKAMGGVIMSDFNAGDCQDHNIGGLPTNYQCAFVEGFADYHAAAVWGAQIGAVLFNSIDRGQYAGYPTTTVSSARLFGPRTEGAVASTFLHIGDVALNPRYVSNPVLGTRTYADLASAGHSQIAAAIRDCRITRSDYSSVQVDGIDYAAYCLEKVVQIAVPKKICNFFQCYQPPTYFYAFIDPAARDIAFAGLRTYVVPGRAINPPPAISWTWGAVPTQVGLNQSVRTVWVCNLFFCS